LPVSENFYTESGSGYLDDPYEGELFAFLLDLFGTWANETDREMIWNYKRPNLQSVNFQTPAGPITVQRGYWFSAHEQWKILVLPYLSIPIAERVFVNCERARTTNSALIGNPGMYASVTDVSRSGIPLDYISAIGIQPISFEVVKRQDVVTPYSTMPSLLVNLGVGLVWYQNMLNGPRMQGPYGSTEAVNINGTEISPLTTWDSKITSLDAMLGGIRNLTQAFLINDGLYERFGFVVNREYSLKFPIILGEEIPFALPTATLPVDYLGYFPDCTPFS